MPVFTLDPRKFPGMDDLEFGNELDFFTTKGAVSINDILFGRSCHRYDLTVDKIFHVSLWTSADMQKPLQIRCSDGENSQTIRYLSYEKNRKFEPELFAPPKDIRFTETR
jgi:hypothetical protein